MYLNVTVKFNRSQPKNRKNDISRLYNVNNSDIASFKDTNLK